MHDDLELRIRAELDRAGKIMAIKVYREATGVGLADAKNAVEAFERGGRLPLPAGMMAASTPNLEKASAGGAAAGIEDEVRSTLQQHGKIQAIKLYREKTGLGLKEAMDAVTELERGGRLPLPGGMSSPTPNLEKEPAGSVPAWQDEVRAALRRDGKIQAIKLYREKTGLGLKEAKDAVDAMEAAPAVVNPLVAPATGPAPAAKGGGCLGVIILLVLALGAAAAFVC